MSRELERLRTPDADNLINIFFRDVIGSKSDAAAAGAVTTTDTLVGYIKQLINGGGSLGIAVDKAATTLPETAAVAQFTIAGGRVLVTSIVGEVTTVIETQANETKLTANPTTGTSVDMCAVLDISADEVGCLYGITGTPADALVGTNAGLTVGMSNKGIVVNIGTIDLACGATNTGETKWTLHYLPIDAGATVVAA